MISHNTYSTYYAIIMVQWHDGTISLDTVAFTFGKMSVISEMTLAMMDAWHRLHCFCKFSGFSTHILKHITRGGQHKWYMVETVEILTIPAYRDSAC